MRAILNQLPSVDVSSISGDVADEVRGRPERACACATSRQVAEAHCVSTASSTPRSISFTAYSNASCRASAALVQRSQKRGRCQSASTSRKAK